MWLPCKPSFVTFNVDTNEVAVLILFPPILVYYETVVFFFKKSVCEQVVAADKDAVTDRVIIVVGDVDTLVPNVEYGTASLLNVLMWVGDSVGIVG